MTYSELLKFDGIIKKLDAGDFEEADKAIDSILIVDSYNNTLKPYIEARQKWGTLEDNKDWVNKWDTFIQENSTDVKTSETITIPEELREGKIKLDKYINELNKKEAEGFKTRVIFKSLDEWKEIAGKFIPAEIRLIRELGIIDIEEK